VEEKKTGLHLSTLLISSAAAVAAAVIVPMFWERGSLIATAITPIIVAIVTEALNRPAKAISTVAPKVTRRSATGAAVRSEQPTGVGARGEGPEQVTRWGSEDDPFGLRAPQPRRRFPLKLALITGALAAVIGAGVVTASELAIFGHSVSGSGRATSVFGGREEAAEETPTAAPEETTTPAPTETATAAPTATATATPTPSVAATPSAAATPVPNQVTPAPTP
jgi:hypothetical protein